MMLSEPQLCGSGDDALLVVLDDRIQAQIGQQLSTFYRELVNQPIPQNFIDLLARLDSQEGAHGGSKKDGQEGDK